MTFVESINGFEAYFLKKKFALTWKCRCEATNHLGIDRSRGQLRVLQGPRLTEIALSDRVPVGTSAVLRCAAEANPMLDVSYRWSLNGLPLALSDNPRLRTGWRERRGYLFIDAVSFGDAGDYTCKSSPMMGQRSIKS